jgi:pyrimidine deaminase RibD-like protein
MLDRARKLANTCVEPFRLGACLTRGGRLLATGINRYIGTNHIARAFHKWPTIHAEVAALAKLADAKGCILYVYRVKKDGSPGLARPCVSCLAALRKYGVKRVVYSINDAPYWFSERL